MSDETAPQPKAKPSWYIGTLAAFAIFVLVAAYASRLTNNYPDEDAQRSAKRYETLATIQKSEQTLLNPVADGRPTAKWVNQDKGLIQVPIDEAMLTVVNDLKSKAPAQAAEIPAVPPPAPAAAAPAGATASAPAATPSTPASTNAPAEKEPAGKKEKGAKK